MMKNHVRLSIALAALVALSVAALASPASPIPDRIAARPEAGRSAPLWIAADVAARDGLLDLTAFAPDERGRLERSLQSARQSAVPGEECPTRLQASWDSTPWTAPATSLEDLLAKSASVIAGTVTETRQGFYAGFPSTIVQIAVSTQLSGSLTDSERPKHFSLLLPQARIAVGRAMLCAVDADYPAVPQIGRRVMVFIRPRAIETAADPIVPPLYSLVVELQDGKLDGPGQFAEEMSAMTFAALEGAARNGGAP